LQKKRWLPGAAVAPVVDRVLRGAVRTFVFGLALLFSGLSQADGVPQVPQPGMVTLANFGATNCIPCRMMAPIRDALRQEYEGRAAILFIDVHRHYEQIELFSIQLIPTLVFYDKDGNEVKRHIGFMDKKGIESELIKLGVE
jgi:thioredoxin 1